MIHPTAIVSPRAIVHSSVEIGPFSVVEAEAVIGQGCKLAGRTTIKGHTILGREVVVGEGAVLGGLPQHISPPERPGRVIVGERTVIRENVTIHRAMATEGETRVGSDCLMMAGSHAAHDVRVGNRVIITNNVLLGGHVQVGDRAVLGGAAAVHQFCRVGRLAMIVGLNKVGLRRSGMTREEIDELKAAYRVIYRQGMLFDEMLAALTAAYTVGPAAEFGEFFRSGKRGFVQERRSPPKAAIRIHPAADEFEDEDSSEGRQRKAG